MKVYKKINIRKRQNNNYGITLIALVITIIVMLIIAGVGINLVLGKEGLLEHAKMSQFSTEFMEIEENVKLYLAEKQIEGIQESFELQSVGIFPVGEKLTRRRKNAIKEQKPELVYKIMELSEKRIEKVNLYWINQEKININKKEKYLIDIETGQIYQYDGKQIYGLIWYTLDNGVEPGTINEAMWYPIDITVTPETTPTTEISISIQYGESTLRQYKIGENNTTWTDYTEPIILTSDEVLTKNWKNDDNTVTIYAKGKDKSEKEIIEKYKILNLDVDAPKQPVIKSQYGYPIISSSGIKLDGETTIIYDERNDIENLYSIDNGMTWQKYEGKFTINNPVTIMAKSVKKITALETNAELVITTPGDSIDSATYDGNPASFVKYARWISKRIQVDSSMWEKYIYITAKENSQANGAYDASCIITAYLKDGTSERIYITPVNNPSYTRKAINIPQDTEYLVFSTQSHSNMWWNIYEIYAI